MRLRDWFMLCYCVPMTALLVAVGCLAVKYIFERALR
jgi:hypothetical protein